MTQVVLRVWRARRGRDGRVVIKPRRFRGCSGHREKDPFGILSCLRLQYWKLVAAQDIKSRWLNVSANNRKPVSNQKPLELPRLCCQAGAGCSEEKNSVRPQTALHALQSRGRFRLPIKSRSNDHVARHFPGIRAGQCGAAGDINKPMMGELDQELDMLAPD